MATKKPCENPAEDARYLRSIRKNLETEKAHIDRKLKEIANKYETAKRRIDDYNFKNKYLKEELNVLRTRCNERIVKLWNENKTIRKSLRTREEGARKRETDLEYKQKQLEEREQKLSELKSSQMEKHQYYQNKIREERSIANRYKAELDRLRDSIEKEKLAGDNTKLDMDSQIAHVREECNNRVDRYRRMYEEGEKLLAELRSRSLQAPDITPNVVEKIDKVGRCMARDVNSAMSKTQANLVASRSPTEAVQTQTAIDSQLLEDMKKLSDKVVDIEKRVGGKNDKGVSGDDMMWYNNKYAAYKA
jgi:chromosome segregation ATPase